MRDMAGVSLLEAVRMATANPARVAGLTNRGTLCEGAFADVVIFDEDIDVSLTMVNGRVVYEK
jgi:N-acetylglucosamine-6-phosphate deacetylase